jgi:hypothetical protein
MTTLGDAFDYAANDCSIPPNIFFDRFRASSLCAEFERGAPRVVSGLSGARREVANLPRRRAQRSCARRNSGAGWLPYDNGLFTNIIAPGILACDEGRSFKS